MHTSGDNTMLLAIHSSEAYGEIYVAVNINMLLALVRTPLVSVVIICFVFAETFWLLKYFGHLPHSYIKTRRNSVH